MDKPTTVVSVSCGHCGEKMKVKCDVGKRAGVPDAHPHRYRDSFAVDLLLRGTTAYDVAKLLGDTVETIEKHYAPFVKELRDRARRLMETGEGLEKTDCTIITQQPAKPRVIQ